MRQRIFLLGGIVLAVFLFRQWRSAVSLEPAEPRSVAPSVVISSARPTPSRAAVTPKQAKAVRGIVTQPQAAAPANAVAFKVVDGFAIAYGDIILGQPEDSEIKEGYFEAPAPMLWDRPEIPFAIHPDLPNPTRVRAALDYLSRNTPLTFVPYETQPDALIFEPGKEHCYSLLGKQGGPQPIRLSEECQWSQVAHEILHALGFVHEQSRLDRDQYIEIIWDNIDEKYRSQFDKVPDAFMEATRKFPFDYRSIMLYPPDMFAAKQGQPTMRSRTRQPIAPVSGQLSAGDLERINRMYGPYK